MQELTGKPVYVRLKWGLEYKGFLVSTDGYMNLQVGTPSTVIICCTDSTWIYLSSQIRRNSRMASPMARSERFSSGLSLTRSIQQC